MRTKYMAMVAAVALAIPGAAQTTAELMQRGIFAQETEGNLDQAIAIYRQIVQSASPQRDLAAQAQLRLTQALMQKGSLEQAAAEMQRLARDFSDQQAVINRMLQSRNTQITAQIDGIRSKLVDLHAVSLAAGMNGATFDAGRPIVIQGTVTQVMFMNPSGAIVIDTKDQSGDKYVFATAAPNVVTRQGMTRDSLKPGQIVTVTGVLAEDSRRLSGGEFVARANSITAQDGTLVWDRLRPMAALPQEQADQMKRALQELEKARAAHESDLRQQINSGK
jgi:hypothetical protein